MTISTEHGKNACNTTMDRVVHSKQPGLKDLIATIDTQIQGADHQAQSPVHGLEIVHAKKASATQRQFLRVLLNETIVAVPLEATSEIGASPEITALPNLPAWVLGVSNIRGEIVSMVDLKRFFQWPQTPAAGFQQKYVILHGKAIKAGILVDGIMGIRSVETDEIKADTKAYLKDDPIAEFLSGVLAEDGNHHLLIMDIAKLLGSKRFNQLYH
jgi:purine-binding chemotaxis protein CheW